MTTSDDKDDKQDNLLSDEDFARLMQGDLNPMGAVMSGKVKIEGDMGVAMKLQQLFD